MIFIPLGKKKVWGKMPIRYTPILRWKRGERVGLQRLSNQARQGVTPLLLLGTDQYKLRPATARRAAIPAPVAFVEEVKQAWGNGPFMLDASAVPFVAGQPHPIQNIGVLANGLGLHLIAATNLGASPDYQAGVLAVTQAANNGVCLRIDLQELTSMANWVGQWPHPTTNTDLIIDFGQQVAAVAALGAPLDTVFRNLNGGIWRSVAVAGTSLPENFGGFAQGLHLIPRAEWTLWQRLNALGLNYHLGYSDFTATSPGSPPPGIAAGFPINVRYTLRDAFLICRGVRTTGPLAIDATTQLRGHANSIVGHPNRNAIVGIWADPEIDMIAAGNASPQGLEHWVRISVCRHVELVNLMLP